MSTLFPERFWSFGILLLALGSVSMATAATEVNAIKSCQLEVSQKGKSISLDIPAHHPGVKLEDGAYCNDNGMKIYKKFEAQDGTVWILSMYADRDQHRDTHFVHRIYEAGAKQPPQVDLVLNQPPCGFLDGRGKILSASLESSKGNKLSINLSCHK